MSKINLLKKQKIKYFIKPAMQFNNYLKGEMHNLPNFINAKLFCNYITKMY